MGISALPRLSPLQSPKPLSISIFSPSEDVIRCPFRQAPHLPLSSSRLLRLFPRRAKSASWPHALPCSLLTFILGYAGPARQTESLDHLTCPFCNNSHSSHLKPPAQIPPPFTITSTRLIASISSQRKTLPPKSHPLRVSTRLCRTFAIDLTKCSEASPRCPQLGPRSQPARASRTQSSAQPPVLPPTLPKNWPLGPPSLLCKTSQNRKEH